MSVSGSTTTCITCGRLIQQRPGGHRMRFYCNDVCRQKAFRQRKEEARRQRCREQVKTWGHYQEATIDYLADLLLVGNEAAARKIAALIRAEQGQAAMPSSNAQEMLLRAAEREQKLEKQVEIQRQRLRQYIQQLYPSSLQVAQEKLLALGAAIQYLPLLKLNSSMVHIPPGLDAWRAFASTADMDSLVLAIQQAQRFRENLAAIRAPVNCNDQADNS